MLVTVVIVPDGYHIEEKTIKIEKYSVGNKKPISNDKSHNSRYFEEDFKT